MTDQKRIVGALHEMGRIIAEYLEPQSPHRGFTGPTDDEYIAVGRPDGTALRLQVQPLGQNQRGELARPSPPI